MAWATGKAEVRFGGILIDEGKGAERQQRRWPVRAACQWGGPDEGIRFDRSMRSRHDAADRPEPQGPQSRPTAFSPGRVDRQPARGPIEWKAGEFATRSPGAANRADRRRTCCQENDGGAQACVDSRSALNRLCAIHAGARAIKRTEGCRKPRPFQQRASRRSEPPPALRQFCRSGPGG
jgi:hypothetical protein